jgi:hypothetical protein
MHFLNALQRYCLAALVLSSPGKELRHKTAIATLIVSSCTNFSGTFSITNPLHLFRSSLPFDKALMVVHH